MQLNVYPFYPHFDSIRFLVTGGAGFIGSHVIDFLVASQAKSIRVLDNVSTGDKMNLAPHIANGIVEFVEGDITDPETCQNACWGVDVVIHLAALGSVPRSVANPLVSHAANSTGFLNMLWAAKESSVKKVVYASSSSVYGDHPVLPKVEGQEGNPLSPYAFTKQSNEAYAKLFGDLYGLATIGLRFFNIFGSRQNKDGPYAAFIPLAIQASKTGEPLSIYGDGLQSRDFTHVSNAVWAVAKSVSADKGASNKAYNVACGDSVSLLDVVEKLNALSGSTIPLTFLPPRQGDVRNSLADITRIRTLMDFEPVCSFEQGLKAVYTQW